MLGGVQRAGLRTGRVAGRGVDGISTGRSRFLLVDGDARYRDDG